MAAEGRIWFPRRELRPGFLAGQVGVFFLHLWFDNDSVVASNLRKFWAYVDFLERFSLEMEKEENNAGSVIQFVVLKG